MLMNTENILNLLIPLLISFMSAGGFGFMNYYIMNELGYLNIIEEEKEDKKLIIQFFSIINFLVFLGFMNYFSETNIMTIKTISKSLTYTLFVTILLSVVVYALIGWGVSSALKFIREKVLRKIPASSKTPKVLTFGSNQIQEVFVFTLDGKTMIGHGDLHNWTDKNTYRNEFSIKPIEGVGYYYTENEAIRYMKDAQSREGFSTEIFIDPQNNLKFIIVSFPPS